MRRDIQTQQSPPDERYAPPSPRFRYNDTADGRRALAHDDRPESSMDRVLRELLECEYLRGD